MNARGDARGAPPWPSMGEPGEDGRFGSFGGRFVPESLVPACFELEAAFKDAWSDRAFHEELDTLLRQLRRAPHAGHRVRTPLRRARHPPAAQARGPRAHRLAQAQQRRSGRVCSPSGWARSRLIAETGAGQHGVATATAAALFGMECVVYMGEVDVKRQELNVFRMELLGAEVRHVSTGSRTLKDAVNEALREWVATVGDTHYCVGSVVGPHPYPWMVREFQRVIGEEARVQCHELLGGSRTPTWWWRVPVVARTQRGSSRVSPMPAAHRVGGGRGGRGCGAHQRHHRRAPRDARAR